MAQQLIVFYSRRREPEFVQGVMADLRASDFHQVGTEQELEWMFKGKNVTFLVLGRDLTLSEREKALFLALKLGIRIGIIPGLYEALLTGAKPISIGEKSVIVFPSLLPKKRNWRRFFGRVLAVGSVVILLPLLVLISLLIRLDSRGPVFFTQERVGQMGKTFKLWKFRTMRDGAEDQTGPILCRKNDERVTRVGKFLRRTHLDELPQLWNIVRGEMNWVGPRPERPVFVRKFEQSLPSYPLRHLILPGLTGEAQVHSDYDTSPEAKLTYDLQHLQSQGVLRRAKVLLATIPALFHRKGRS